MRKTIFTVLLAITFGLGLTLLASTGAMAVHKGAGNLTCGGCHTMHNSQNSTDMGGAAGGSMVLLRGNVTARANMHMFCLTCHAENGTGPSAAAADAVSGVSAPKVARTTATTITNGLIDFSTIGAGGDFMNNGNGEISLAWALNYTGSGVGYGHGLGQTNIVPPGGGDGQIDYITCTNCHDPHGTQTGGAAAATQKFRNLKRQPPGGGGLSAFDASFTGTVDGYATSYVGGITGLAGTGNYGGNGTTNGANHYWPIYRTAGSQNTYRGPGTAGVLTDGISAWCAQCHDLWHQENTTDTGVNQSGQDWKRHPVDRSFTDATPTSGANVTITDWTQYTNGGGTPLAFSSGALVATKLPMAHNAAGGTTYYGDDNADRVFCLSCHFPHAGPFPDALRWQHALVGSSTAAASALASNVGCEQCHNK